MLILGAFELGWAGFGMMGPFPLPGIPRLRRFACSRPFRWAKGAKVLTHSHYGRGDSTAGLL